MTDAIDVATFQADLLSARTFRKAANYTSARGAVADAEIVLAGLVLSGTAAGVTTTMRSALDKVIDAIDRAEKGANKAAGRGRLIRTQTSHAT